MGYYTLYELEAVGVNEETASKIEEMLKGYDVIEYALEKGGKIGDDRWYWGSYESVKWYDNDEHMTAISKAFPDVTFCLSGDGEDSDDFWKCYYKNGVSELCKAHIVYDEPQTIVWKGGI